MNNIIYIIIISYYIKTMSSPYTHYLKCHRKLSGMKGKAITNSRGQHAVTNIIHCQWLKINPHTDNSMYPIA